MKHEQSESVDVDVNCDDEVGATMADLHSVSSDNAKKVFGVSEYPPWHVILLSALQQMFANLSGPMANVYILWSNLCAPDNDILYAELLSTALFTNGLCTILQTFIGIRLPIVQGSSSSFITVVVATMATPEWKCPVTEDNGTMYNSTSPDLSNDHLWKPRLLELSGSLILASFVQVLLGCSGCIGFLMRFIGPITILVNLSLVGLSLFPSATAAAEHQWGIAVMVVGLIIIFSMVMNRIVVPIPNYNKKRGCHTAKYPIFRLFPHLFAIGLAWTLCYILTVTDVFPTSPEALQYNARTDAKQGVIGKAKWWFWPYPGMWGWPTASPGVFVGMLAATVSSIVESIGDYYATASICEVPSPPKHALNRGIGMEGLGAMICGTLSIGHATTSYSGTVGFIGITGVRSRVVWQVFGLMMLLCGCVGKIGAALSIIPDPILGGMTVVGLGMVISVGISNMRFIDPTSARNMLIIGVSLMMGMMVPNWIMDNPGIVDTGSYDADQIITQLLSTAMFVGGILACVLDNIVPGTKQERGMMKPSHSSSDGINTTTKQKLLVSDADYVTKQTYDIPYISDALRRVRCCSFVPFLPSYKDRPMRCCKKDRDKKIDNKPAISESCYDYDITTPL